MKKLLIVLMIAFIGFLSLNTVSATTALFSGVFANGTTLYSMEYFINGTLKVYNAYPIISEEPTRIQNCTVSYTNKTKCSLVWHPEIRRRVRECESYIIATSKCTYQKSPNVLVGCMNPGGVYTNALPWSNFYYKTSTMPSFQIVNATMKFVEQNVSFRVDIPAICSPGYNVSGAIRF